MAEQENARIYSEKLDQLMAATPMALSSSSLLLVLNCYVLYLHSPGFLLVAWFCTAIFLIIFRLFLYKGYLGKKNQKAVKSWLRWQYINALLSGLVWGFAVLYLMPESSLPHQFVLTITAAGLISGASNTMSLHPKMFAIFMLAIIVPMSIKLYVLSPQYSWMLFGLCYVYAIYMQKICYDNYATAYNNIVKTFSLANQREDLASAARRLNLQIDSSPLGVIEWDSYFNIVRCNPAIEKIFGYTYQQLKSMGTGNILFKNSDINHLIQLKKNNESLSETISSETSNGKMISCDWTSAALKDESGQVLGFTSFIRDVSNQIQREALIKKQAYFDAVTGLANRYSFQERLDQELSRVNRSKMYSAVLFLDLDNFKYINDSLGHTAGDELLKQFGERLQKRLRLYEAIARFGGDEFVILLEELDTDIEQARLKSSSVATSILEVIQQPFILSGNDYVVSCSIGISLFNNNNKNKEEILKQADLALYESKDKGRNTYNFFAADMGANASRQLLLLNSIRGAVDRNEMWLVFQPKAAISSKQLQGAEVLLRWKNKQFGFVSPAEFIPIIENLPTISKLGFWVIEQSVSQLKDWQKSGLWPNDMKLSINLSPRQLLADDFVSGVLSIMEKYQLNNHYLEFEITENILLQKTKTVETVLSELTDLGFSFSIDDFGTGYSSLAYLKRLPISVLKIDKSFVDFVCVSDNDRAIIKSMLGICRELQLTSVAEGVETEEQRRQLLSFGCDLIQGYLYSKPLNSEAMTELLTTD